MARDKNGNSLSISPAGMAFIKGYEKEVLSVYNDGYGYLTVGIGHRVLPADGLKLGQRITQLLSAAFFAHDLAVHSQPVDVLVKVPLTQNQYDALVSLVYNIGGLNFAKSSVLRQLNAGNYAAGCGHFGDWTRSAGKVSRGLVNRRAAEKKMFLSA